MSALSALRAQHAPAFARPSSAFSKTPIDNGAIRALLAQPIAFAKYDGDTGVSNENPFKFVPRGGARMGARPATQSLGKGVVAPGATSTTRNENDGQNAEMKDAQSDKKERKLHGEKKKEKKKALKEERADQGGAKKEQDDGAKDVQHLVKKKTAPTSPTKRKAEDESASPKRVKGKDGEARETGEQKKGSDNKASTATDASPAKLTIPPAELTAAAKIADAETPAISSPSKRKRDDADEMPPPRKTSPSDSSSSDSEQASTAPTSPPDSVNGDAVKKAKKQKTEPPAKAAKSKLRAKGLSNPHNLCYRNSVIQFLSSVEPLRDEVMQHAAVHTKGSDPCIACMLARFFKAHFHESTARSSGVKNAAISLLKNLNHEFAKCFRGARQQDASEYMREVQRILEKHSAPPKPAKAPKTPAAPDNIIHRVFEGTYASVLTCPRCHHSSVTTHSAQDISLFPEPLAQGRRPIPLSAALAEHFAADKVEATCEKCKQKSAKFSKSARMESPPKFLTIHVSRHKNFAMLGRRATANKLMNPLTFDSALVLAGGPGGARRWRFALRSLIGHYGGSMESGHYIACVRQPDGSWAMCDDSTVSEMREAEVLACEKGAFQVSALGWDLVGEEEPAATARKSLKGKAKL